MLPDDEFSGGKRAHHTAEAARCQNELLLAVTGVCGISIASLSSKTWNKSANCTGIYTEEEKKSRDGRPDDEPQPQVLIKYVLYVMR